MLEVKLDELLALLEVNNPDLIETWLSADILDAEIDIPGYFTCGSDRDKHEGGVMLCIRDTFHFSHLPSPH